MSANGMMRKLAESLRKSGRVRSVHGSVVLGFILLDVEDNDGTCYQFTGKAVPAPWTASDRVPVPDAPELPRRSRWVGRNSRYRQGQLPDRGPWRE